MTEKTVEEQKAYTDTLQDAATNLLKIMAFDMGINQIHDAYCVVSQLAISVIYNAARTNGEPFDSQKKWFDQVLAEFVQEIKKSNFALKRIDIEGEANANTSGE